MLKKFTTLFEAVQEELKTSQEKVEASAEAFTSDDEILKKLEEKKSIFELIDDKELLAKVKKTDESILKKALDALYDLAVQKDDKVKFAIYYFLKKNDKN